jgi:ATP-binding cassette subfamily A (ABC1) protein 3
VTKFLKLNLGVDVKFVSQAANEVTYQVPTDYNSKFKEFFVLFDSKLEELSVHSYGITVTTLEEVFLKAGEENHTELLKEVANDNLVKEQDPDQGLIDDYSIVDKSEGNCCTNMKAMCMKRGMLQRRQTKNLLSEVLLPVVFVILGITITQIQFFKDSPSRSLLTNLFPLPQRIKMNS